MKEVEGGTKEVGGRKVKKGLSIYGRLLLSLGDVQRLKGREEKRAKQWRRLFSHGRISHAHGGHGARLHMRDPRRDGGGG